MRLQFEDRSLLVPNMEPLSIFEMNEQNFTKLRREKQERRVDQIHLDSVGPLQALAS
jgi:hypothetical protein